MAERGREGYENKRGGRHRQQLFEQKASGPSRCWRTKLLHLRHGAVPSVPIAPLSMRRVANAPEIVIASKARRKTRRERNIFGVRKGELRKRKEIGKPWQMILIFQIVVSLPFSSAFFYKKTHFIFPFFSMGPSSPQAAPGALQARVRRRRVLREDREGGAGLWGRRRRRRRRRRVLPLGGGRVCGLAPSSPRARR